MIEVPQEQLSTIFEAAQHAAQMARSAFTPAGHPGATADEPIEAMLPASPLAAEIFKTLIRCHVKNRDQRLIDDFQAQLRNGIPANAGQAPVGGPVGANPMMREMGRI